MKIAICDDEKICRNTILTFLKPYLEKDMEISEFACGEDLIFSYENKKSFDLIFLDVEMKALDGVATGHKVRELDANVMFIFVTGFTKYVPDAFELNAFQFLVKPVEQEKFDKEFKRAKNAYSNKKFSYKISFKEQINVLEIKDIFYIETYTRHLRAVTAFGKFEFLGKLNVEESKLIKYGFLRCHQGYLINMYHIKHVEKNIFFLKDGSEIPISKYLKNEVMKTFNKFVSGCSV